MHNRQKKTKKENQCGFPFVFLLDVAGRKRWILDQSEMLSDRGEKKKKNLTSWKETQRFEITAQFPARKL